MLKQIRISQIPSLFCRQPSFQTTLNRLQKQHSHPTVDDCSTSVAFYDACWTGPIHCDCICHPEIHRRGGNCAALAARAGRRGPLVTSLIVEHHSVATSTQLQRRRRSSSMRQPATELALSSLHFSHMNHSSAPSTESTTLSGPPGGRSALCWATPRVMSPSGADMLSPVGSIGRLPRHDNWRDFQEGRPSAKNMVQTCDQPNGRSNTVQARADPRPFRTRFPGLVAVSNARAAPHSDRRHQPDRLLLDTHSSILQRARVKRHMVLGHGYTHDH